MLAIRLYLLRFMLLLFWSRLVNVVGQANITVTTMAETTSTTTIKPTTTNPPTISSSTTPQPTKPSTSHYTKAAATTKPTTRASDIVPTGTDDNDGKSTENDEYVQGEKSVSDVIHAVLEAGVTRERSDHVFLFDASGSVRRDKGFLLEQFFKNEFRKFLRNGFLIHPDYVRLAMIVFDNDVRTVLDNISVLPASKCDVFGDGVNGRGTFDRVNVTAGGEMNTKITAALERAEVILKKGLNNRKGLLWGQYIWIFTDGEDSHNKEFGNMTKEVVERLKKMGLKIFSIALPTSQLLKPKLVADLASSMLFYVNETSWRTFISNITASGLKGLDSMWSLPTVVCPSSTPCGANAACYCDCVLSKYSCACSEGYQPNDDSKCSICGDGYVKTSPGNSTCSKCDEDTKWIGPHMSCEVISYAMLDGAFPWVYMIIALTAIGFVTILTFLVIYVIWSRRLKNKRDRLNPPPGIQDLESDLRPTHNASDPAVSPNLRPTRVAPDPPVSRNFGYVNREAIAFLPDVIHSTRALQRVLALKDESRDQVANQSSPHLNNSSQSLHSAGGSSPRSPLNKQNTYVYDTDIVRHNGGAVDNNGYMEPVNHPYPNDENDDGGYVNQEVIEKINESRRDLTAGNTNHGGKLANNFTTTNVQNGEYLTPPGKSHDYENDEVIAAISKARANKRPKAKTRINKGKDKNETPINNVVDEITNAQKNLKPTRNFFIGMRNSLKPKPKPEETTEAKGTVRPKPGTVEAMKKELMKMSALTSDDPGYMGFGVSSASPQRSPPITNPTYAKERY